MSDLTPEEVLTVSKLRQERARLENKIDQLVREFCQTHGLFRSQIELQWTEVGVTATNRPPDHYEWQAVVTVKV